MTLPDVSHTLPMPARSLPLPVRVTRLTRPAGRLVPAIRGPVAMAAVGLAAEFALRTVANRALALLGRTPTPAAPLPEAAGRISRTVVTEIVVRERFRRSR